MLCLTSHTQVFPLETGAGWVAHGISWPAYSEAKWVLVNTTGGIITDGDQRGIWIQNFDNNFTAGVVGDTSGSKRSLTYENGTMYLGISANRGVLAYVAGGGDDHSNTTSVTMHRVETSVLDTMGRDGVTDLVSFDNTDRELTVRTTVGGYWVVSIPGTTGGSGWTSWGQVPSPSGDAISPAANVRIPIYTGSGWDYVRWSNLPSGGDGGPTAYIASLYSSGNTLNWTDQDDTAFSWTPTGGTGGWTSWSHVPSPGGNATSPSGTARIPVLISGTNWDYVLWSNLPSDGGGGWSDWDDVDPPAFGQIVDNTLTRIPAYYSSTGAWGRQQPAGIVNAANESYDIITNASGWNDDDYIMTHSTVTADAGKQIHRSLVMGGSGWNWPLSRIFQGSLTSSTDVAVETTGGNYAQVTLGEFIEGGLERVSFDSQIADSELEETDRVIIRRGTSWVAIRLDDFFRSMLHQIPTPSEGNNAPALGEALQWRGGPVWRLQ